MKKPALQIVPVQRQERSFPVSVPLKPVYNHLEKPRPLREARQNRIQA